MPRTIRTEIQKRFSDIDSFRHVNNVSQQMYFDVGKSDFFDRLLGPEILFAYGSSPPRPTPPTWGRSGSKTASR